MRRPLTAMAGTACALSCFLQPSHVGAVIYTYETCLQTYGHVEESPHARTHVRLSPGAAAALGGPEWGVWGAADLEARHLTPWYLLVGARALGLWGFLRPPEVTTGVEGLAEGAVGVHFTSFTTETAMGCDDYVGHNSRSHVLAIAPGYVRLGAKHGGSFNFVYEIDDFTDTFGVGREAPSAWDRHGRFGLRVGALGPFGGGGALYASLAWGPLGFGTEIGFYSEAGAWIQAGMVVEVP